MADDRLMTLGRERAQETGRAEPNESDMDWALAQMKPGEEQLFGTADAFDRLTTGMREGAGGAGTAMAQKKSGGRVAKKRGAVRRAGAAIASAGSAVIGAITGKRRKRAAKGTTPAAATKTPRRRAARGGKRGKRQRAAAAPLMLPQVAGPGGLQLYEAREIAPGVYEAAPPVRAKGRTRKRSSGGIIPSSSSRGGVSLFARPKGLEYLTLGAAGLGAAPLGFWLQNQAQVPIPFTGYTIGRGSLAAILSLVATVVFRKWKPRIARHTAIATVGFAGGVALQKRATKGAEAGTV